MTKETLREKIGQLLMMGVAQPSLTDEEKAVIQKIQPSGVIYFRRNVESPAQLQELTHSIGQLCNIPPLIGIDQEGGRVARLGNPFTIFPGNHHLGNAFVKTNRDMLAYKQAQAMAKELKAVGINLNFTPVADIDTNPKNPVIGTRAFSSEADITAKLVATTIRAYRKEKVISCAKHFPGHGDSNADSHLVLPYIDINQRTLIQREIVPFISAIRAKVPTIMTAHVVYPRIDSRPATLSKKIMVDLLRKKLKFTGVLISDDMEMSAIASSMDIPQASVEALNAGVDMLLVCQSLDLVQQVHEAIAQNIENGKLPKLRVAQALERIAKLKKNYLSKSSRKKQMKRGVKPWPLHQKLAEKIKDF